jgi:hypothetical protein
VHNGHDNNEQHVRQIEKSFVFLALFGGKAEEGSAAKMTEAARKETEAEKESRAKSRLHGDPAYALMASIINTHGRF